MTFDPEVGARVSSALIKAIMEAKSLADAGDVDAKFRDLIRHARDLYKLLLEEVIAAGPDAAENVRGVCDAMGNRLDLFETLMDDGLSPPTVH